ncbi:MAG: hypothetical protein L0H94_07965, partial [Nitrospira sp.]|nr:hypothetical protein [Nitrospira sp.]
MARETCGETCGAVEEDDLAGFMGNPFTNRPRALHSRKSTAYDDDPRESHIVESSINRTLAVCWKIRFMHKMPLELSYGADIKTGSG